MPSNKNDENYIAKYMYTYLENIGEYPLEYEIRFGTKKNYITKNQYDNTLKKLKSLSFEITDNGHVLSIQTKTARVQINGIYTIQEYCNHENIKNIHETNPDSIVFQDKRPFMANDIIMKPYDYEEYNFRVSLQEEQSLDINHFNSWASDSKSFRLIHRITASSLKYPGLRVDISIVKSNYTQKKTIKETNLFNSNETYEIELEYEMSPNDKLSYNKLGEKERKIFSAKKSLQVKQLVTEVLRGIQNSVFPIPNSKKNKIYKEYFSLCNIVWNDKNIPSSKQFIGPSSISLERKHVQPNDNTNIPSILKHYTVTEKADGERRLLYISNDKEIYFITNNLSIIYTGMNVMDDDLKETLLDGEYVSHDKNRQYINLYMIFDVYFLKRKDFRTYSFIRKPNTDKEKSVAMDDEQSQKVNNEFQMVSRFEIIQKVSKKLTEKHVGNKYNTTMLKIRAKKFHFSLESIYNVTKTLLHDIHDDIFDYETDGIIFTPAYTGVGIPIGGVPHNKLITWRESFKWKPPEFNSVDFVIVVQKDKTNKEIVKYTSSNDGDKGLIQYKTLLLYVGYNDYNKNSSCFEMLYGVNNKKPVNNKMRPVLFEPTNPTNENAKYCNVRVKQGDIYAENGEVIETNTVVECRYDPSKPELWRWVPMRIRHDKTHEYRKGYKFGNAYHVANSVWNSIHFPVTEKMITSSEELKEIENTSDAYYNFTGSETHTKAMRDFHNLYVKKKLIESVSQPGYTLLDLSVGKGGDIPKWLSSKLGFVLGIDINQDNIDNDVDGVCKRYSKSKHKMKKMFDGIFIRGDSGKNIKNGESIFSEQSKEYIKVLYGTHTGNNKELPPMIKKYKNIGKEGFDIVSCQFAMHYFFNNLETLHQFIRNIVEGCKLGGHFIATTYDGDTIFNRLKDKRVNETESIFHKDKLIWAVTKQYQEKTFSDDETSVNIGIDVFQESINKSFREYLVNSSYFIKLMRAYGFEIVTNDELEKNNYIHRGTGMFSELYQTMKKNVKDVTNESGQKKEYFGDAMKLNNPENQYQKSVSFMNRYFIFKKVLDNDIGMVYKSLMKKGAVNDGIIEGLQQDENKGIDNGGVVQVKTNTLIKNPNYRKEKMDLHYLISNYYRNTKVYKQLVECLRRIGFNNDVFNANEFILYITKQIKSKQLPKSDYELYKGWNDFIILQKEKLKAKGIVDEDKKVEDDEKNTSTTNDTITISNRLQKIKTNVKKINKKYTPKVYLDFGAGDGYHTRQVMSLYNIENKDVYVVDKVEYPSIKNMNVNFIQSTNEDFKLTSLENNSVDLVSVFMVLHHIDEKYHRDVIQELNRVLKPGGMLILREHNTPNVNDKEHKTFKQTIDIVHDVYDYIIEPELLWNDKHYYAEYKSMLEWDLLMKANGFTSHMKRNDHLNDLYKNPQRAYMSIYQK
jgi:ubiquinone/menaquinone biosynthesis C-methylase UbiE